jgi:hypothetical protein
MTQGHKTRRRWGTTAEDNFQIDGQDRVEKRLVNRSPDSSVSQAARQAAIRGQPGNRGAILQLTYSEYRALD